MSLDADHRFAFMPDDTAPGEARRFLEDLVVRWGMEERLADAQLMVSELVTNIVRHTRSAGAVEVSAAGGILRVATTDRTGGDVRPRHPRADEPSGRGLSIVEALASRWGVEPAPDGQGKTVWFELDLEV